MGRHHQSHPAWLQAVDTLLSFGAVLSSRIMQAASSVELRIRGNGPADDESDDPNGYEDANAEFWGLASVLYRPQDGAETIFWRMGDERVVIATKDRRWQSEHTLEKGEAVLRYCGDVGGAGQPDARPYVHLKSNGEVVANGVKIKLLATGDVEIDADATVTITGNKIVAASNDIRLTGNGASDAVALASKVNDRNDAMAQALDVFCGAVPVSMDGGAALQAAVRAVWTGAMPTGVPTASSDVGSDKIKAS